MEQGDSEVRSEFTLTSGNEAVSLGHIYLVEMENMDRQIGSYQIVQKHDRRRKSRWLWAVRRVEELQDSGAKS